MTELIVGCAVSTICAVLLATLLSTSAQPWNPPEQRWRGQVLLLALSWLSGAITMHLLMRTLFP